MNPWKKRWNDDSQQWELFYKEKLHSVYLTEFLLDVYLRKNYITTQ